MLSQNPPPDDESQAERDRLITTPSIGIHRVYLGYLGYVTRPHWGLKPDWAFADCVLVLVEYLGSGMWVRYPRTDIVS